MEMLNVKIEERLLKEIDKSLVKHRYSTRSEFVRDAIREKLEEAKLKQAILEIAHLKGASKRKTTEEEYENMRKLGFEKIAKDLK